MSWLKKVRLRRIEPTYMPVLIKGTKIQDIGDGTVKVVIAGVNRRRENYEIIVESHQVTARINTWSKR